MQLITNSIKYLLLQLRLKRLFYLSYTFILKCFYLKYIYNYLIIKKCSENNNDYYLNHSKHL